MRQILLTLFLSGVFLLTSLTAQSTRPPNLQALIKEALNQNPQLKAYRHLTKARDAEVPAAGALPDPTLGINLLNLPWNNPVFDQEAMSGKQISLAQKIPFPGKLGLKKEIAKQEAQIARANYEELKNRLIKKVKEAYYDLFYIDQAILTTQKNQVLLKEFVEIATTKYAVGKGLQQDVLKAQVELAHQSDLLLTFRQKRRTVEARLNRLLNAPPQTTYGRVPQPDIRKLYAFQKQSNTFAINRRPLLVAWQKRLQQSKEKISLARKNFWPDFSLSLAYTQRDVLISGQGGTDFISLGLRFNLPVYFRAKQSPLLQASLYQKNFTEESLSNTRNEINEALDNALSALQKNLNLEKLYRLSIIPQARQALESARAGYQNDKVDFLTLLNNEITLFKFELSHQRIVSDSFKSFAELEYVVGHTLQNTSNTAEER